MGKLRVKGAPPPSDLWDVLMEVARGNARNARRLHDWCMAVVEQPTQASDAIILAGAPDTAKEVLANSVAAATVTARLTAEDFADEQAFIRRVRGHTLAVVERLRPDFFETLPVNIGVYIFDRLGAVTARAPDGTRHPVNDLPKHWLFLVDLQSAEERVHVPDFKSRLRDYATSLAASSASTP